MGHIAGPITLLSNVNFHLNSGAVIWFEEPGQYAEVRRQFNCGANGNLVQSRWQATTLQLLADGPCLRPEQRCYRQ